MKTKRLLLAVLAALTLSMSHAQEGNVTVDMSVQTSFWISFVSEENLYFNSSYSSGLTEPGTDNCFAFKVVAKDLDVGIVYLKHISVVPANTPIWIWGGKKKHSITTFSDLSELGREVEYDDVSGNLLFGSATLETPVEEGDYLLSKNDDYVHQATVANGIIGKSLPKGKCLLRLGEAGSRATLHIGLLDDDDETQAIDAVMTREGRLIVYDPQQPSYDAQGRRIPASQKGLHIQNGQKFYIK
jgi:hypothetical protein